ncbi:cytochrome bc complex cytochrome b subunit [Agromyces aurantiacus]|uniref:Cytochrome bc1 complex cytochrome b subunit n=1 Tax=Agromyces aurantiacus TaxID=165814 RepID=A0ABV9R0F8_9MICO|nr:cytochrome b N-terminal domain-containing protein [Agromyces aurantiacus]MBM7505885.1 ubiquinol-cytochrome c reductase cytochrome b subunit [Agromyces aurantiacus]
MRSTSTSTSTSTPDGTGRRPRTAAPRHPSLTDRLAARLAEATVFGRRIGDLRDELRRRAVPTHWTNLFGVVTLACLVVVAVTGLWLMFFYTPSSDLTTYRGGYAPLHGAETSEAFASTMRLTFDVPGGLLMRQAHHWAALLLPASIIMQLVATFFTGGFRRPRRGMWVLLFLIFVAALAGGWSGYALPDDLLSGTGLRITEGIALGIPVVGTWLASLLFGGGFPGRIIEHLYPLHVAIVPAVLVGLVALRAVAAWRAGPAQFPGPGRSATRVVGAPLVPTAAARAGGLFLLVTGVLLAISATVTVNPLQLYGPASSGDAGAGSQPDWYTGFLDGALRLVPSGWEVVLFDRTWTLAILVPLAVVTVFLVLVAVYPFVEEWATGDRRDHHLLERPRLAPTRTGIGVAGIVFYGVLWTAGSADLIATQFRVSFEGVIGMLQALLIVGPCIGFGVARRVCLGLQRRDRDVLEHGFETGRLVRLPGGEVVEVHQRVGETERVRMSRAEPRVMLVLRPDERGRLPLARRVQVRLGRWFLADSIDAESGVRVLPAPVAASSSTPAERERTLAS